MEFLTSSKHNDEEEDDDSDEELEDFLFGNSKIQVPKSDSGDKDEEKPIEEEPSDLLSFAISTKPSHYDGEKFVEAKDDDSKKEVFIFFFFS